MGFIDVDEFDFQEVLQDEFKKDQTVILKFGTQFCDACMSLGFELEELEAKHDSVSILEIDCNESVGLAEEYGIVQVPFMVVYRDAETILYSGEGVVLAADLEKIIGV